MPPVCKFWQQGNCKFGNNCKFEHPGAGQQNGNRFAALDHYSPNDRNNGYQSGGRGNNNFSQGRAPATGPTTKPYRLDKDAIIVDLSTERPQWILSAYGPGFQAPEQLFGGPLREQSFEEMRLLHYMGQAAGNPQQAVQDAQNLVIAAEQQMQQALHDPEGAINYVLSCENKHPNRLDVVRESTTSGSGGAANPSPFGQPSAPAANGFGAPSQPSTNAFGAPSQPSTGAFGASSQPNSAFGVPGAGAFGQPSSLGQKPNAFGTPSQSAFGAPSQLGNTGAFGQPSALGQKPNPFGASGAPTTGAFGQPSALGSKPSAFGAPTGSSTNAPFSSFASTGAFGQPAQPANPNPFGASSQPTSSTFGQPSQPAASNPFGAPSQPISSAFGQPPQPAQGNPFGAPSQPAAFGQPSQPAQSNPFGQQSQPAQSSPFGQPSQPAQSNAFGQASQPAQSSPFGQPTQPPATIPNPFSSPPASNAFGAPSQPAAANPFGAPSSGTTTGAFGQNPASASALGHSTFGAPTQSVQVEPMTNGNAGPSPYAPNATLQHPPLSSYASKDGSGRLIMFKGKPVRYKDNQAGILARDGSWQKIWFPDGPPPYYQDTEKEDSAYDDTTKQVYLQMRQTGVFQGGVMPMVPPKREWCLWDF
ncbi:hypothetical protein BP5796_07213 [Coleophoma crateriformis]|uniref:C3H1-type domain-containing protein n=1 Tax=Coleophoma crateriformis TaxID=565419 RepID=A0A3D8RIU7_9HELO|nr:hypothetical protein BP5796_07213 [Coleophoma crateriformis]